MTGQPDVHQFGLCVDLLGQTYPELKLASVCTSPARARLHRPSQAVEGADPELEEYREAERLGASGRSCQAAFSQCPVSLFRQLHA